MTRILLQSSFPTMSISLLLLASAIMMIDIVPVVVRAQSSSSTCSSAQNLVPGTSISMGPITDVTMSGSTSGGASMNDLCDRGSVTASVLPQSGGHWFSFITSENRIIRLIVELVDVSEFPPNRVIFKGSCESLTCEEITTFNLETFIDAEADVDYFIYAYRTFECVGQVEGYSLSIEQIEPPINDKIDNAIALTNQDLPFEEEFTTYGALSDFGLDACGLFAKRGVWFTYNTTVSSEWLTLRAPTGNLNDVVGIQVRTDTGFECITSGRASGSSPIEWIAQSNVQYYILITEPSPEYSGVFPLSLQSREYVLAPTTAENTVIPTSPAPTRLAEPTGGVVSPPPPSLTPVTSPPSPVEPMTVSSSPAPPTANEEQQNLPPPPTSNPDDDGIDAKNNESDTASSSAGTPTFESGAEHCVNARLIVAIAIALLL